VTGDTADVATPAPPRLPAGERLRRVGTTAWALIGIGIVGAALIWGLFKISVIFPPLILAVLIIYLLNPVVTRLELRGIPRAYGTLLAYVLVLGSIAILITALIPVVSRQVEQFSQDWPVFRNRLVDFIDGTADSVNDRFGTEFKTTQVDCLLGADERTDPHAPTSARCDAVVESFRERLSSQASRLTQIGSSVIEILLVLIIGPLIALYLLIDLPHLQRDTLNLLPEANRAELADLGSKIGRAVGGFFRGQLLVALFVGLLSALGFAIVGLPFWFVIGAIAGFFNLIPLVGPFIGGGLGFLIGTVAGGVGLGLRAALVELIVQQVDNHFISPQVMKRTVKLHPATVMLGLLAGGTVGGFWGVLLAVPGIAVVKLTLSHLWATRVLGTQPAPHGKAGPEAETPAAVPEEAEIDPDEVDPDKEVEEARS
jgi:predicted PurR-regulated permease PerM